MKYTKQCLDYSKGLKMLAMLSIIAIHSTEHQECFSRNNGYGFQRNHVSSELLVGGGGERTSRKDE